jgi:hypothetical protein
MATAAIRRRASHELVLVLILVLLPVGNGFVARPFSKAFTYQVPFTCQVSNYNRNLCCFQSLSMYSNVDDDKDIKDKRKESKSNDENFLAKLLQSVQKQDELLKNSPPFNVEDTSLLFYDVFLIVNLALSISFWVTHRLELAMLPAAFSEGSLMSLLWIGAGLYNGAFLCSAKDGHYDSADERGGPKAAGLLAFLTFLNAINLRLVVAFGMAFIQHRPIGSIPEEQIMPLEMGFGLLLMSVFRFVHSSAVPRI